MTAAEELPLTTGAPSEHFHVGCNAPAHTPEPVSPFAQWTDAQTALAAMLATHADALATWAGDHDCDDIPCPTFGDTCPWQRAGALTNERDDLLAASAGQPWSAVADGVRYWLTACAAPRCLPE